MEEAQFDPDVAVTGTNTNSAATIDHSEVHVDLTNKSKDGPAINTGGGSVQYTNDNASVIIQTKPDPADKPKDFVVTSCFVIMLCNACFGFAGWHYGLKANNAWQLGDEVECRKQAKRAKIFVILGVIAGICTWVLAFVLFFTLVL